RYTAARHEQGLRNLRQAARLRAPPLALDGRDEAPVRPESPAGPDPPQGLADARLRVHPLPEERPGHQSRLGRRQPGPPVYGLIDSVTLRPHVRELVAGARAAIEASRARIDDLNVYPVPDGDTGTNLTLTVRAIGEALAEDGPDDRRGLAHEVWRAALMGARGNSGVILSQIVRGACDALAESDDLALVFRSASDAAYRAVK